KKPGAGGRAMRASSIHERLPDRPVSAGTPITFSIGQNMNTASLPVRFLKRILNKEWLLI
ncbi:hypothetical protein, partial [Tamilnaduibacter salinus]|uniref:hypothetical protein n=1 Tax=Tamilnaduibacter salinus TaxID=1484056 RepID=UPI001B8004E6